MDAHVTDSAGTPAEPDSRADEEPPTGTSGPGTDHIGEDEAPGDGAPSEDDDPEDAAPGGGAAPADDAPEGHAGDDEASQNGDPEGAAPEDDAPEGQAPKSGAPGDSAAPEGEAGDSAASQDGAPEGEASGNGEASEDGRPEGRAGKGAARGDGEAPESDAPKGEFGTGRTRENGDAPEKRAPQSAAPGRGEASEERAPDSAAPGHGDVPEDDDPEGPADNAPPADATPAPTPNHKRHWLRWAALGTAFVVLAAAGAGWWFYRKLDANITTDTSAAAELETYEKERPTPIALDAQNILLLGSDTRSGEGNSEYGRDDGGSQRSDTTILLHIAADHQSATAMSIPRDLMVTIPSCRKADGTRPREMFAQFNWAFEFGGTACTIRTIERFTGIRIDHHMVVDFRGFKDMVEAVDGVEVCLKEPIDDPAAHLELPAGKQTLNGEQALGFVRARKSLGNGSDTERMDRQQQFLGALVKKVQSNGVLLNPTRLYPVLDAATKSITTDPGLDSLRDLYELTRSIRNVPTEKVQFLTVPRQPYAANPNRDELIQPKASQLFKRLHEDTPIAVVSAGKNGDAKYKKEKRETTQTPDGSDEKPDDTGPASPTPTPTFSGTNAAVGMCE